MRKMRDRARRALPCKPFAHAKTVFISFDDPYFPTAWFCLFGVLLPIDSCGGLTRAKQQVEAPPTLSTSLSLSLRKWPCAKYNHLLLNVHRPLDLRGFESQQHLPQ